MSVWKSLPTCDAPCSSVSPLSKIPVRGQSVLSAEYAEGQFRDESGSWYGSILSRVLHNERC